MKKRIAVLVLVLVIMASFLGCSSNQKSEEEMKAEIKAEMKAEMEAEKNNDDSKVDIKDMDALYKFVKENIVDITRKNFDSWEVYYFDITGNGTDEAVLVSTYGVDWYKKMEIISGDSGKYKRIASDIPLAKDKNVPKFEDGFLTVVANTSGTGENWSTMDFYKYNGSEIINVLDGLLVEHEVAAPNTNFKETAKIDGATNDFTYTLTKYDKLADKETIEKKKQYTYNDSAMSFDVKSLKVKNSNDNKGATSQSSSNGRGTLYLSNLKNGDAVGGGLTIRNIDYIKGGDKASFTLAGTAVLRGELYFDEMSGDISLRVTDNSFSTSIVIEGPNNNTFEFKPDYLTFRNKDALLNNISSSYLNMIKNGRTIGAQIRVKDISTSMKFESGSGTSCEFIDLLDSYVKD